MKKQYIEGLELLEVGFDHLSSHLGWLLRSIISETTGSTNAVASLVYNRDIPKNVWGMFHGATRSIAINLEQHFFHALDSIQGKEGMYTSIRVLLLHDLLDSCAHEGWHAKQCNKGKDWTDGNLDEDGAKTHATAISWEFAELWDVNVHTFGPLLDGLLHSIYKDLKEDIQDKNCKEWKKLQYYMLENEVNYYNPDRGIEINSIREVFAAQTQPETPWIDTDNSLFSSFSKPTVEKKEVIISPDIPTGNIVKPETTTLPEPIVKIPVQPTTTITTATVAANYDPLGDSACDMGDPFADDEPIADMPIQAAIVTNAAPTIQTDEAPATAYPSMDVQKIQQIAEKVLRRMFHHVYTKCEFNTLGGYNNTNAVLEPINISDIEGASELFAQQDTLDDMGVFVPRAPVGNFIKGLPTNENLPRYTFYLNIGGTLHKRVYIAQNPNKKKSGIPTAWAQKAMHGGRIMMLLADGAGITAHTELEANQILGQEKFVLWNKK